MDDSSAEFSPIPARIPGATTASLRFLSPRFGPKEDPSRSPQRTLRVGEMLRRLLAEELAAGTLRDPGLVGVRLSVSEVRPSRDLRHARVYVMLTPDTSGADMMSDVSGASGAEIAAKADKADKVADHLAPNAPAKVPANVAPNAPAKVPAKVTKKAAQRISPKVAQKAAKAAKKAAEKAAKVAKVARPSVEGALAALDRAAPFLSMRVAKALRMKYAPRLAFHVDDRVDASARVDQLLREQAAENVAGETNHPAS